MNIDSAIASGHVLYVLTWGVRVLTVEQVQRMLDARCEGFGYGFVSARSLVRRRQAQGLVNLAHVAAAFYEVTEPIVSRSPGAHAPDFGALAWQLELRWRNVQSRRVTICWATPRAARLYGGLATFDHRSSQLEHDLGTASVLVRLHEMQPKRAEQWVGEEILRRDFAPQFPSMKKIPDGAIVRNEAIVRVVEFGGQYSATRLRQFDAHFCNKHRIPYDLW